MIITAEQLTERLHNTQYHKTPTLQDANDAKESGLVIISVLKAGYIEVRGAVINVVGPFSGGITLHLYESGLLPTNLRDAVVHLDDSDIGRFFYNLDELLAAYRKSKAVTSVAGEDGYAWTFQTDIPHETFDTLDGDQKFCRGIVIRQADLKARPVPSIDAITALTERSERAESLACSILESLKLTPHSLLVVKTGDVMPEYTTHEAIKTFQRVVPENVAIVFGDEKLDIEMLDEGKMREAGWVRADAATNNPAE